MTDAELSLTGGDRAGQRLSTPTDHEIRPMRSRVRQALFDLLEDRIRDRVVMDGFAGTGALGLEALSRGANHVTFIDSAVRAAELIRQNVERLEVTGQCDVKVRDLLRDPPDLRRGDAPFDVVFLTPPYRLFRDPDARRSLVRLLEWLCEDGRLAEEGMVIVESETGENLGEPPVDLHETFRRTFGRTEIKGMTRRAVGGASGGADGG